MCSSWIGMLGPNLNLGGTLMGNDNCKYNRFDSFLNKTIILSSKQFYEREIAKNFNELPIIDDESYNVRLIKYLQYDDIGNDPKNISDFINLCENPGLVCALKSLSDIEKTVIFLLFEEQLTSKEASKILKICSDSVTRIRRRALKKIEKYMKGDEWLWIKKNCTN